MQNIYKIRLTASEQQNKNSNQVTKLIKLQESHFSRKSIMEKIKRTYLY